MTKSPKKPKCWYYPSTNIVKINVSSSEVYPIYLKYVFEYLKIPADADIIFKDRRIVGGVRQWRKETHQK